MKVYNIGYYPPPYGGISIHIQRLKYYLDKNGIENVVIDTSKNDTKKKRKSNIYQFPKNLAYLKFFLMERGIIHFHYFYTIESFLFFFINLRHKVIISFHNERFLVEMNRRGPLISKLLKLMLNQFYCIIVDSELTYKMANQIINNPNKIYLIPEYIPPFSVPDTDEQNIIKMRKSHKYLLSSFASHLAFWNGEDLYGVDLIIDLMAKLIKTEYDVGLCFLIPDPELPDNKEYLKVIRKKISEYKIEKSIYLVTHPLKEATSLFKISDIMIRATNTDGNSVSVLESLSMGTIVLASDCVPRPLGVNLFRSRDIEDFYNQTTEILNNLEKYKQQVKHLKVPNNANKIINLYKSIK